MSVRSPALSGALRQSRGAGGAALLLWLAACTPLGPNFKAPQPDTPAPHVRPTSAPELTSGVPTGQHNLPVQWWTVFDDEVLNALQQRLNSQSPDLQTATLRFAESRLQQATVTAQAGPRLNASSQATRLRSSENGPEMRLINAVGGNNTQNLVKLLTAPYPLYQAGFDASWELDLWGRLSRSAESAGASSEAAGASLQDVQLSLSSELARDYFQLRQTQLQRVILERQTAIAADALALLQSRRDHGLLADEQLIAQRNQLASLQAQVAPLLANEASQSNQIGLLVGALPGELRDLLAPHGTAGTDSSKVAAAAMPDLNQGLPASLTRRRPDIRAAEARLHAATADIGIATADLYPRVALGASLGLQSMSFGSFGDWGSRTWQVGPMLSLPLFDQGLRRTTVDLRKLLQQEAAIAWHKTVLKAWHEVDDALASYGAEQRRQLKLQVLFSNQQQAWQFAQARFRNGLADDTTVLRAELDWLQARLDLANSATRLQTALVAVFKAVGGGVEEPAH